MPKLNRKWLKLADNKYSSLKDAYIDTSTVVGVATQDMDAKFLILYLSQVDHQDWITETLCSAKERDTRYKEVKKLLGIGND